MSASKLNQKDSQAAFKAKRGTEETAHNQDFYRTTDTG